MICRACDHWASSTWDKETSFVSLSFKVLPSVSEPGRFLNVLLTCPSNYGNFLCCITFWIFCNSTLSCLLLVSIHGTFWELKSIKKYIDANIYIKCLIWKKLKNYSNNLQLNYLSWGQSCLHYIFFTMNNICSSFIGRKICKN